MSDGGEFQTASHNRLVGSHDINTEIIVASEAGHNDNMCLMPTYVKTLIDSAPRLGVYYFLSLTMSVCLYLRLSR